jgi:aspartyl-tRNA(Asn)/glutamyl-tRNA(Gln) amidotransferase subunit C
VPPTSHAVPLDAALREDIVRDSLPRSELLAAAPATEAGAFAVPKVLEGDA